MKKFFFISSYFPEKSLQSFLEICGKDNTKDIKLLLIENAADVYEESKKGFVYETREKFHTLGLQFELCDLNSYFGKTKQLEEKVKNFDVVWFGGGNVYHLRYCFEMVGLSDLEEIFEDNSIILAGGSAGTIIFSPSLVGYEKVDSPSMTQLYMQDGLGWFPLQIIPHWNHPKYQSRLEEIEQLFLKKSLSYITLKDAEAIIGTSENYKII